VNFKIKGKMVGDKSYEKTNRLYLGKWNNKYLVKIDAVFLTYLV
jgi:hypothetical protein